MSNFITSAPPVHRVTEGELTQIVQYFEHLEAQKKNLADEQKELLAQAKGRGYNVKIIRKIIARRKRDREDVAEEDAVVEMYEEALGMM